MKFTKIFKKKEKDDPEHEKQKRFFCPICEGELFLNMKFCDKCGGEVDWPEEYQKLTNNKVKSAPISKK
jgi:hypothetical protein